MRGLGARFLKQPSCLAGSAFGNMNAIPITIRMRVAAPRPRVQFGPVNGFLGGGARSSFHRAHLLLHRKPSRMPKAKASAKPAWVSPLSERLTAKLICSFLALSAIAVTALGFMSLLERAQNSPIFDAWIRQLLGA
jgi:hypothetical protein